MSLTKQDIQNLARDCGFDLCGIARAQDVEPLVPAEYRPSAISLQMRSVIVVARKTLLGIVAARHNGTKQFWAGRILKSIDLRCLKIVEAIERAGGAGFPVSPGSIDLARRSSEDMAPAGQGSIFLRTAAVQAGLGTLGLNMMLLTPRFGPRVFLGAVLTDLDVEPDSPLTSELCLGLEKCGRCAAVCPEDAIPRRAARDAPLSSVRGLDAAACIRSSQPYGPAQFASHIAKAFGGTNEEEMWSVIRSRTSGALWQEMVMIKEGAYSGCTQCVQVCPVGEDYERFAATPHRAQDLAGGVRFREEGEFIEVVKSGS